MKIVILAGGLGTRLSEETSIKPKPMVEIGGYPILWHIMKIYSHYGLNEFIICLGYKGYVVKEYFANYFLHSSDVTFDIAGNQEIVHRNRAEPWKVTLINTGDSTQTGGRVKRIAPYLDRQPFCLTYGDGVADIDIQKLIAFHEKQARLATVSATRPPARFGALEIQNGQVTGFEEKPVFMETGLINGGFFVLSPKVIDLIDGDETIFEREPLERLVSQGELSAYVHTGFWQPMDTLREKMYLERLYQENKAPWVVWS